MLRLSLRVAAAACAALALALVSTVMASAHAVLTAGSYRVAIGWEYEPVGSAVTYVGQPNGVQVFVDTAGAGGGIGTPVSDLNQDCSHPDIQVTVTYAGTTSSALCPAPAYDPDTGLGRQDEYDATLTPTAVGDYTFRIFGTIHGTHIDQSVKSGPSTFDTVGDATAVQFPTALPPTSALATKVERVDARATSAETSAHNAGNSASGASTLAIVAIVIAVLGTAANVGIGLMRRRA